MSNPKGRPVRPSTFPRKVYRLRRAESTNPHLCEWCHLLPAPGELVRCSIRGNRIVHDVCVSPGSRRVDALALGCVVRHLADQPPQPRENPRNEGSTGSPEVSGSPVELGKGPSCG